MPSIPLSSIQDILSCHCHLQVKDDLFNMVSLPCGTAASRRSYISRIHSRGQECLPIAPVQWEAQETHTITMNLKRNEPLRDPIHVLYKVDAQNNIDIFVNMSLW